MIESTTRNILRSGASRGVALSPRWLQRYNPTRLHVVHVNGFVLVFPTNQANQLEEALGKTITKIVQESLTQTSQDSIRDSETHERDQNEPTRKEPP